MDNKGAKGCLSTVVFIIFVVFVIRVVSKFSEIPSIAQIRYSAQYNIPWKSVAVYAEPTDCDFIRAPIGSKPCHYDRQVEVMPLGTETGTGRRIISFDNGKTVTYPDKDHPAVIVSWQKIEEP